ncbi:hypothetical protein CCACVL1_10523 [Corchorus capsularis]|uniref:Uncharacterized protein n=1 Tax=Corchorus capsularis TaxID=210143 RepID=A0A1R3IQX3_COCAP|nr:hypothetical protein CCACVL1_10523 [Corchorus capsularis]
MAGKRISIYCGNTHDCLKPSDGKGHLIFADRDSPPGTADILVQFPRRPSESVESSFSASGLVPGACGATFDDFDGIWDFSHKWAFSITMTAVQWPVMVGEIERYCGVRGQSRACGWMQITYAITRRGGHQSPGCIQHSIPPTPTPTIGLGMKHDI